MYEENDLPQRVRSETSYAKGQSLRGRESSVLSGSAAPPPFSARDSARSAQDYQPIQPFAGLRAASGGREASRRIVIAATPKGGSGKTFFLVNLADWLTERNIRFVSCDTDWSSGTLTRFQPGSRFVAVQDGDGMAGILHALDEVDLVLVDGSAAVIPDLLTWMESLDRVGGDIAITLVCTIEEDKDTVFQAGELRRRFGTKVDWLVVRTLKTGPATEIYDNSKTRQELLRQGAGEITIPRLPWNLLSIMQRTSQSLSGMLQDKGLSLLERHRLRSYQERLFEQLSAVEPVLLPRVRPQLSSVANQSGVRGSARPRIAPEEV
jgi:hypothetical protein